MRKLILALAFVFFSSSLLNANSSNKEYDDCAEWAWGKANKFRHKLLLAGVSVSDWDLWEFTDSYYDDCIGN